MSSSLRLDEIASRQAHYSWVCHKQNIVLREHPEETRRAYNEYSQMPEVAKKQWRPTELDKDAFFRRIEERCSMEPKSIYDRVKIFFAAHAMQMYIIQVEMAELCDSDRFELMRRSANTSRDIAHWARSQSRQPITPNEPPKEPPPLERKSSSGSPIDLGTVQNPTSLIGKQFILDKQSDNDNGLVFEIVGFKFSKDAGWVYDVQFEDCQESIELDDKEVKNMLKRSLLM